MIPKKITFRLQSDEAKKLYFEARDEGISSHQKARDIMIEGLHLLEIVRFLEQIAGELAELRLALSLIHDEHSEKQLGTNEEF